MSRATRATVLVAAPLLLLASAIVLPANSNDIKEMVDIVVRDRDRVLAATLLAVAAQALLVPALVAVRSFAPARSRLAWAGLGFAVAGVVAAGLQAALGLFEWQMAAGDRGQMVALLDRLEFEGGTPFVLLAVGFLPLGLALLSAALWRARSVPRALPAAITAGAAGTIAGYEIPSVGVRIAGTLVLCAALIELARREPGPASAPAPRAA